jgi:hypothetical protein
VDDRACAGFVSASAGCSGDSLSFRWTFSEDPQFPTGHPEWVGYDVLRRSLAECGPFVRVNAEPFPRVLGATESFTYREAAPAPMTTFEYRLAYVDANRQPVVLGVSACDDCAFALAWASCPQYSAPLTQGTLGDWGWALYVQPTTGTCYESFYFDDPRAVEELRPYAGTGTTIRLFGEGFCGTVEGCGMRVDHYEAVEGPTPVHRSTWGHLKVIYR